MTSQIASFGIADLLQHPFVVQLVENQTAQTARIGMLEKRLEKLTSVDQDSGIGSSPVSRSEIIHPLATHEGFERFLCDLHSDMSYDISAFCDAHLSPNYSMRLDGVPRQRSAFEAWLRDVRPLCGYKWQGMPWFMSSGRSLACIFYITYSEIDAVFQTNREIIRAENTVTAEVDEDGRLLWLNKTERVMRDSEEPWRPR